MAEAPKNLGPFEPTHVLGKGGMGVVYAAKHQETGAQAAVKTVIGADEVKLSQIRREIHALARLHHPGVVEIQDQGVEQGWPWYAMELLEGSTLRDLYKGFWRDSTMGSALASLESSDTFATGLNGTAETLPTLPTMDGLAEAETAGGSNLQSDSLDSMDSMDLDDATMDGASGGTATLMDGQPRAVAAAGRLTEVLSLLHRLCDVLSFVHGEGVVHRDLKPDNIFVRDNGLPVVVDFGLVAQVGGTVGREVIGGSDRVAGSLAYMSPEQLQGELLDARSDLYALGCILYQLLTNQPPFQGDMAQVRRGHLEVSPTPPSTLVTGVPPELDRLVLQLLAKDRDLRIGYAEDVARTLEAAGSMPRKWEAALPTVRSYLYRPAFVGRKKEVAQINTSLDRPMDGDGAMLFIAGESGVGKTRLALEVANMARHNGLDVLTGECGAASSDTDGGRRVQDMPLEPLQPLLSSAADRCVEGGTNEFKRLMGDSAKVLAAYSPAIGHLPMVAGLPEPPPLPGPESRARLFKAINFTLKAMAESKPLLLVLDDLQWADELTLDWLEQLSDEGQQGMATMLIGTYRSEEATPQLEKLATAETAKLLSLARLEATEVGEMVGGMLALREPPQAFVKFLAENSEGNPFFVAEYLRTAVAEEVLVRNHAGEWMFADTSTPTEEVCKALPLPRSLREVVELRLTRLTPEARKVIDTAALLGRRFDEKVLQIAEGLSDEEMIALLDEMVRRQVLEQDPAGGYRFIHDKLREIPEADMEGQEKLDRHQRIASVLEETFTGTPKLEEHHATIGYHWSSAHKPERAAEHLHNAALRAKSFHAVHEAIDHYRSAQREVAAVLSAGKVGEADSWRQLTVTLSEELGDALELSGKHEDARASLLQGIEQATEQEKLPRARMYKKIGKIWEVEHDHAKAEEAYGDAVKILGEDPDGMDEETLHQWIQVLLSRIWVYYWMVRVEDMNADIQKVKAWVEEQGTPLDRYHYYLAMVLRDYRQYRYRISDETMEDARSCVAAAREASAPAETAFARFVYGFGLLFKSELGAAEAELYETVQTCRSLGDVVGETRAAAYLMLTHRRQRRVDEAAKMAEEVIGIAQERKMMDYVGLAQAVQGWVAYKQNDREAARELSEAAFTTWEELPFCYPFKWTAGLNLLRVLFKSAPLGQLVDVAEKLLDEGCAQLPEEIDSYLVKAVEARDKGDHEGVRKRLKKAVVGARDLGFI